MKKNILTIFSIALISVSIQAQEINLSRGIKPLGSTVKKAENLERNNDESSALKEALELGAKVATAKASSVDGFYKNEMIKIPFPQEMTKVKERLLSLGFDDKITEFEKSLNRAAESASKQAFGIVSNSIKNMTVNDAVSIVKGNETAATTYLKDNTSNELYRAFEPIVNDAINENKVSSQWNTLASAYNKIPGLPNVETDINKYVIEKTIDGLFVLIAEKEKDIRQNPAAQASDLINKIFGK